MLDFFMIFLIAISLSMDTFSLSIIYGTLGLDKKKMYTLSLIVGIFHFFMPFFGSIIGSFVLEKLPIKPDIIAGVIFIIISIEMVTQKESTFDLKNIWMLFLFALTVSLDSFSVGIGISLIIENHILAYFTFFIVSMFFTFIGLRFGKYLSKKLGSRASLLGGLILGILGAFYIISNI